MTETMPGYSDMSPMTDGRITEMSKGRLRAFFREEPMLDEEASRGCDPTCPSTCTKHQGRPVFKMVDFIRIQAPGERDNIPDRPVTKFDRERFAQEYDHWKKTRQNRSEGMPLEAWAGVTKAQVEELRFFHITTVEDLAALSDGNALRFQGIQTLKQKAKDYVAAMQGQAPILKLREEHEADKKRIETLEKALAEQAKALEDLRRNKR